MNAGNIHVKILADAEAMYREFQKVEKMAKQAAGGISGAFADVSRSLGGLIGAASGLAGVVAGLSKLVAVQRQFDVLNSGLITMTGSVEDAKAAFGALQDFAAKTPYSLAETVGAFTKLKALGLDPTERAMTSFGNTAAAMGKGLDQFIEAVADAGTGEFERLKEFGIKASKEGSNVSLTFQGVTTTIRNSTEQITEYLTKIGENQFAGAMETRAKTLDGAISALGDTWDNLFLTISQQNAGGFIADSVQLASGAIQSLTKIIEVMSAAADDNARSTGAMAAIQNGITRVFETVAVVGANVAYVLKATGIELGGLAAQAAAVARLDFKGAALIGDEMKRDAAAARAAVDSLTAGILNAKNQTQAAGKSLDDLVKPRPAAKPPIDTEALKAAKKAMEEIEKEAAKGLELYNNLIAETAGFQGDYAEKASQLAEAYAKNKISLEGVTFAHEKLLAKQPAAVEATKMEAEARKVLADAVTASARAYEEAQQAMDSQVQALWQSMNATTQAGKDEAEALRFELSLMGKSADARVLEIEQNKIRIKLKRELAAIDATPFEDESQRLAARVQAEENAAREMANAGLRVQLESQKTIDSEWKKTTEQINQSLTDALMRGFESGKGFVQNLRDTAVNLFKTMVLRPVISAVMSPIAGAITGALGLAGAAGAANAATQGIGAVGAVGTGASILGSAGTLSMLGSNFGAGFTSTVSGWFSSGAAVASLEAGGMGAAFNVGAAAPYIGAALVAANALGLFRKTTQVDNGIKGTIGYDSDLTLFDRMRKSGTLFSGPDYWDRDKAMDPKLAQALDTQVRAIYTAGEQYAAALGLTADGVRDITREIRISTEGLTDAQVQEKLQAEFTALGETIAQSLLGTTQTITETVKEMQLVPADDDMGMVYQEVEKTITRVVAVQSEYARTGETSAQTLQRLAGSLVTVNGAFDMLGLTMLNASLASGDYASQLIDAVGGGDAFAQAAGSYFESYYTEAEKVAYQTELVTKELATAGLTMPKTRAEFKAMVEAQRALGPAGKDGLAALLRVNGAFAQLVPAADEAAGAVTSFFDSLAEGVSGQIEGVLTNVLLGKADGATAGAELAAAVVGGVQQAIISGTTSVIAETFTASIIAPIIANVTAGRAAMEGVDLDGAIAAAGAQMQALQAVLTSPEVTSGFASITGALNGLVGAAQSAAGGINAAAASVSSGGGGTLGPNQYSTGSPFAIGGSASTGYQNVTLPTIDFSNLDQEISAAMNKTVDLLDSLKKTTAGALAEIDQSAQEMMSTQTVQYLQDYISRYQTSLSSFKETQQKINNAVTELTKIPFGLDGKKDLDAWIESVKGLPVFSQEVIDALRGATAFGGDNNGNGWSYDRLLGSISQIKEQWESVFNPEKYDAAGVVAATKQLDTLKAGVDKWVLAQSRLVATQELVDLDKQTRDATAKISELKRTGGLEDPITKLKEAFAQKIKAIDDGIGKILTEEINTLLGKKADTSALEAKLAEQKATKDKLTAPGYLEQQIKDLSAFTDALNEAVAGASQAVSDQIAVWAESIGTDMEAYNLGVLSNISGFGGSAAVGAGIDAQAEIVRLQNGGLDKDIADISAAITSTEDAIKAAVLAATDPAKREALQKEIDTYKGGITEWFKAQAELLSTEMLVDINAQIRELEKADQGPLTAIKAGIQKYIDDLKALDQLAPAAQAQIDKLSNLQLTQVRGDLEAQLLSKPELEARDLSALTANFAALGQQLPATAADFKALLATIVDPAKRDALLELIPAFVALRPPLEGATDAATEAAETIQQAYDRLRAVNRTSEDIARERIALEERLAAATQTQAQALEAARNAIDPYNRTLYDQVLAAEEAKAAAQALAQTQREVVAEMRQADIKLAQAMGDTALAERLQREAFVAGLSDLTAAQQAAKIGAYDYARAVDAQIAAMQRADTAVTSALAAVGRAVDAEKRSVQAGADAQIAAIRGGIDASQAAVQAAQDRVGELTRLFDDIAGAVKKLRGDVEPERQMLDARAYIDMSLSLARAGTLPDQQRLAEAISAVTSDSADRYSSMVDYQFAQKVQAGKLDELGGLVGEQKTAAEQQLEAAKSAVQLAEDQIKAIETAARAQIAALDAQLAAAREQVDVLRGVDNSVMSVADAVNALSASIAGLLAAKGGVGGGGGGIVSSAAVGSVAAPAIPGIKTLADIPSDFELGANRTKIDANGDYAAQTLLPGLKLEYVSNENASMIGQLISAYSGNLSQLAADYQGIGYTGTTVQGLEDWARQYGVPGFDQGAAVIPQDMLAMVHKGEQIIPAPWNPAASGIPFRGGGGNDAQNRAFERLTTEMSAMRAELAGLRQENAAMQRTIAVAVKKTADVQERYEAQVLNA